MIGSSHSLIVETYSSSYLRGGNCLGSKTPLLCDFVASREFSIFLLVQVVKALYNIKHNKITSNSLELRTKLEVV